MTAKNKLDQQMQKDAALGQFATYGSDPYQPSEQQLFAAQRAYRAVSGSHCDLTALRAALKAAIRAVDNTVSPPK